MTIKQLIAELEKADDLNLDVIIYDEDHSIKQTILSVEFSKYKESQKEVAVIKI